MATKIISLARLTEYDGFIKAYIDSADATKFQAATVDNATGVVNFYKTSDTTGTPDFTFTMPGSAAMDGKADKVTGATNGNLAGLDSNGNLTDAGYAPSYFATAASVNILNGDASTEGSVAKAVADEATARDAAISSAVGALDGAITGSGKFATQVSQTDGVVSATMVDLVAADIPTITLDKIFDAGTAAAFDKTDVVEEGSVSLPTGGAVVTYVKQQIAGLEGAMHFIGVVTRTAGQTDEQAIAAFYTTLGKSPEKGDVVVISDNAKEYICSVGGATPTWREVGDEGLYVQKSTTIAGVDLQDDITKSELLTALNVADGAQVNVLEGVSLNGTDLTIDANKKVALTVATGTTDGSIAVNGTDYTPKNLKTVATTGAAADVSITDTSSYYTSTNVDGALDEIAVVLGSGGTLAAKADKVVGATNGNFAGLDSNGNLTDAGVSASSFWSHADYEIADAEDISDLFSA